MINIDISLLESVSLRARNSARKRSNHNFHHEPADLLQRMLNAIEPGSYVQPHKHENPDKREAFFCLRGRLAVVEFDDEGNITAHTVLDPSAGTFGVEIAPRTWHTIFSLEPGSVAYEVKDGPYDPSIDKNFAPWAPEESDPDAIPYLEKLAVKLNLTFSL
jgi:cupin fold WbuC family metalloprotein